MIERVFNAPPERVFAAWTVPEQQAHWSGPEGFTTPHHAMDLRVGGRWRACLRSPQGEDHWVGGVYREIDPPRRLVMTHGWQQEDGRPSGPETVVTVSFTGEGAGRTRMRFHQAGFDSIASRDGHQGGWSSSFDKLAAWLDGGTAP